MERLVLPAIFSFLIGSIPFGLVFSRMKGVDLTKVGSGNIGATNAMRAAGKGVAALTLLGDLLKGTAAVALGKALGVGMLGEGILGLCAIAGHDFSIFLRFRGGKGVATSLGVMLLYSPKIGILTVIIWLGAFYLSRYSSVGAITSFLLMPVLVYLFGEPREMLAVAVVVSGLLIFRHFGNIIRLIKGTESRIGKKTT